MPKLINDLSHLANRCMPRLHTCKHTRTCIHALLAHPRGKKYWSAKGHSTILPQTLPQNSRWLNTPSPNYLHRPCPRLPTLGKNLGVQRPMLHQGDLPQGRHSTILPQTFPQNSRWLNTPSLNHFHRPVRSYCSVLPHAGQDSPLEGACDFLAYETGGECTTSCCTCARILKFHR